LSGGRDVPTSLGTDERRENASRATSGGQSQSIAPSLATKATLRPSPIAAQSRIGA
jgi:hypothetical protein